MLRSSKFRVPLAPFRIAPFHGISLHNRGGLLNHETLNATDRKGVEKISFHRLGCQKAIFHKRFHVATPSYSTSSDKGPLTMLKQIGKLDDQNQKGHLGILKQVEKLIKQNEKAHAERVKQGERLIAQNQKGFDRVLKHLYWREKWQEANTAKMKKEIRKLDGFVSEERTERMRLKNILNVRGAIECILGYSQGHGDITGKKGKQDLLDKLVQLEEFQKILKEEAETRLLNPKDIEMCLGRIYHNLSKHAHGHDETIVINDKFYVDNEQAGLVALMKYQAKWQNGVAWREERPRRKGELRVPE